MAREERRTGRATDIEVASRAAIRLMKQRLAKAALKRHPGLKVSDSWDEEAGSIGTSWKEESESRSGVGDTSSFVGIDECVDIVGQYR